MCDMISYDMLSYDMIWYIIYVNKLIPTQVYEWCLIQTGQKPLCDDKSIENVAIDIKQRNKSSTDNE